MHNSYCWRFFARLRFTFFINTAKNHKRRQNRFYATNMKNMNTKPAPAVVALLLSSFITPCDALFFQYLWDFILQLVLPGVITQGCAQFESVINPNGFFECTCDVKANLLVGLFPVGMGATIDCAQKRAAGCFDPSVIGPGLYCGLGALTAQVAINFAGDLSLESGQGTLTLTDFGATETARGDPVIDIEVDAGILGTGFGALEVRSCSGRIGHASCTCGPCDSDGSKFDFDCSSIPIVYRGQNTVGPRSLECIDFADIF